LPSVVKSTKSTLDYLFAITKGNECPKLTVSVYGCEFTALLDSGANRVFVGLTGWDKLRALGFKLHPTGIECCTLASASEINCIGAVNVPLMLEGRVGIFEVLVVPEVRHEMILGVDFWAGMGIVPNLRHLTWEFADSQNKTCFSQQITSLVTRDDLSTEQRSRLEKCVKVYFDSTRDSPLGCTDLISHKIVLLEDAKPLRARNYRVSPFIQRLIDKEVEEMLKSGVIERAESEWNSPYLMVPKKDGTYRFVIDFRGVNARSKRVCYPLPNISHILDSLGNARYLSSLDIKSAYWEVPLEEASRPLTAFSVAGRGQFQFRRMPFGLHSAAGTFQALVDRLFTPDLEPYVFAYLDDIIVSTPDFETHLNILRIVFDKLKKAGLTLKESKCEFCKPELRYLGYVVNRQGLNVDPAKVSAVVDMPQPKGVRDVRRLIGMMSWYRRFVPNFSTMVAPLTNLTKKKTRFTWTPECEGAFSEVKNALVNAPILSCPNFSYPFTLQCDASDVGIGAVLTQNIDGKEQVICYLSRALLPAEQRYSTTEKECLSVIYAIERLRCYLEGTRFTVVTDHYSLLWLNNLKDPLGRVGRWVMRLQAFDFDIVHRKGKDNVVPDCLSRAVAPVQAQLDQLEANSGSGDKWIDNLIRKISTNPLKYPNFRVREGHVFKKVKSRDGEANSDWKWVVPKISRAQLLKRYHDEASTGGHLGVYKTYHKISNNHTWPKMRADVCRYVRRCPVCASVKPEQRFPAGTMGSRPVISRPWQLISADLFGPLPRSTNGHEYVLVVTDYFSKFPLFVPVRSPTARKIIDEIERRVFLMFGVPEYIIVDNGVQFGRSREFQDFLVNYGVKPYYNSLYTPQNNPTERVNRTMKSLIVSYIDQDQRKWDNDLDRVACALRTARHEATRQTPYYLNFGTEMIDHGSEHERRRARESLDEAPPDDNAAEDQERVRLSESKLDRIRRLVTGLINKYRDKAKRYYDARRREIEYSVGDLVWKKSYPTTDSTKHFSAKLAKQFSGPFRVTERIGKNVYALVDDLGVFKGKWHVKDLKPDRSREIDNETVSSSPEPSGGEQEDSDGDPGTDTD
jgi:hypothetical protein